MPTQAQTRGWIRWAWVLGFALGGFFDGILLHQILQWHHLLSAVPAVDSLRAQMLWDGYFHALMYVLAAAGLWGLWRTRTQPPAELRPGRLLAGGLLAGFGLWHLVDAVLSHALLGIHRIRPDSPAPLAWDLGWAVIFGLLPLLVGWAMQRARAAARPARQLPAAMLALVAVSTAILGGWSLREPPGQRFTTVVFAPGVSASDVLRTLAVTDARLVWSDRQMSVVVLDVAPQQRRRLFSRGAWLVSGAGLPAGCFSWTRT